MNKAILVGRIGKDAILNHTPTGIATCTTSIATSESYRKPDGTYESKTEWHNLVLWRQQAEYAARNIKKGDLVEVVGKITHRSYDSNGLTKTITEIVVSEISTIQKNNRDNSEGAGQQQYHQPEINNFMAEGKQAQSPKDELPLDDASDDLPF